MKTKPDYVLERLKEGPMCSQSFFHEDKHRTGITHRCAADVERLRNARGHTIISEKCVHGRRGAVDYTLYEPGQQAAWF